MLVITVSIPIAAATIEIADDQTRCNDDWSGTAVRTATAARSAMIAATAALGSAGNGYCGKGNAGGERG
jgi:hypothetical protein